MNCSLQSLKDSLYKALATEQNVSEQPPPPDESSRVKKSVNIGPKNIPLKPTRHPKDITLKCHPNSGRSLFTLSILRSNSIS